MATALRLWLLPHLKSTTRAVTSHNFSGHISGDVHPSILNTSLPKNGVKTFSPCCTLLSKHYVHSGHGVLSKKKTFSTRERVTVQKDRPVFTRLYQRREKFDAKVKGFLAKYTMEYFVNKTPDSVRPYLQLARVDKPTGTLLLYLPCVYGITMATPSGELPSAYYLGLFGLGAFLMRGAGCVINDLWDQDFDKQVDRTKGRPLASGQISQRNAIALLAVQLSLSLGILLSLNMTSILIGVASMVPVIIYPLAKRFTMIPQAVLGLTINIGALMGYAAVAPTPDWLTMSLLYGSCFMWTLYYDTVYAFQDVQDDKAAGVKSITLLFQKHTEAEKLEMTVVERMLENSSELNKIWLFLYTSVSLHVILFSMAGMMQYLDGPFYLAVIIGFGKSMIEASDVNPHSRQSCWKAFNNNRHLGYILALGVIVAKYLQPKKKTKISVID